MLEASDVGVRVAGKTIIESASIRANAGEVHIILGPKASGKTSLLSAIAGLPGYEVFKGDIVFDGRSITGLSLWERARLGIALAHQIPPRIRYVKASMLVNAIRRIYGIDRDYVNELADLLRVRELLDRQLFHGLSGGERKRLELFLVLLQRPKLALLDEPDSGVDVESIYVIADAVRRLVEDKSAVLLVTHTQLLLERLMGMGLKLYAHVLLDGRIMVSGDAYEIAPIILKQGFHKGLRRLGVL